MTPEPAWTKETADEAVAAAAAALRAGAVVAMPTDTVYGLAADPTVPGAAARLFSVKGRPETVALPVLVADVGQADDLAGGLVLQATRLAVRYWPGPLTIVVPRGAAAAGFELGGDAATIGIRCPAHPAARSLLRVAGPLAVTSANRHGEPPLTVADAVRATFGAAVATVLDGGTCDGTPSTVVKLTAGGRFELLRAGAIDFAELLGDLGGVDGRLRCRAPGAACDVEAARPVGW